VLEVRGSADSSGRVTIRNLSIVRAQVDQFSSGLYLSMPASEFSGEVLIERVQFSGNQGQQGSALRVIGGDKVTVRNSVFVFNRSKNGRGVASIAGGDIRLYFVNNTFMYNAHDLPSTGADDASALYFGFSLPGTLPQVLVANNLFWANDTPDLFTSVSGIFHVYNNNFLRRVGQADFEAGNLSVDPQLVNAPLDFTPAQGSPMIDQGYPEPTPSNHPFWIRSSATASIHPDPRPGNRRRTRWTETVQVPLPAPCRAAFLTPSPVRLRLAKDQGWHRNPSAPTGRRDPA